MQRLMELKQYIGPYVNKKHIQHQIDLERNYKEIVVEFSYGPKEYLNREISETLIKEGLRKTLSNQDWDEWLERWESFYPIQQLLTLSIDDCNGFRGCAHKHDQQQRHILGDEQNTTYGMMSGIIPKGALMLTVSAHCLVGQSCTYCLTVYGKGVDDEKLAAI